MSNVEEKKSIKRGRILDAASSLFMNKSFASTAVDDVVRMAGVAKGTFYLYFKDKYDLLNEIVARKSAEVLREGVEKMDSVFKDRPVSLTERAVFITDFIADYLYSHRDLTALLNKNLTYCFRYLTSGGNEEFSGIINLFIEYFKADGYSEEKAKKVIYLMTDLVGSVCCDAVLETGPFTLDEIKPALREAVAGILEVNKVD